MTRVSSFMGRKRITPTTTNGGSQQALLNQFNQGMDDVMSNLREFIAHMDYVAPDVLVEVMEPTFGKALTYCPRKNGDLRASGYLESRRYYKKAEVEIGFGRGGRPGYAIYVHEMPYHHESPTRDKFLQAAVEEDYFSILTAIPRAIREAAGT